MSIQPDTEEDRDVLLERYRDFVSDYRVRLANVRALHPKSPHNPTICETCLHPYPCPTIRACEGKNE